MKNTRLQAALAAISSSFQLLEEAAARAAARQLELATEHDTALAHVTSENSFLKEDNLRLSNQLQSLQKDFLELQEATTSTLNRLDDSVKAIDLMLEH